MVAVQIRVLATHHALLPLHTVLALPVDDLLAVGRDLIRRVLPVLGVVPVARHRGVQRGEAEVVEALVLAVGAAPVEAHTVVHGTVPHVLRVLAALPPHLPRVGGENLIWGQLPVLLLVPLLGDIGMRNGKVIRGAHQHVVAIRTAAMGVCAIVWRRVVDVLGVLAAPPPHVLARPVGDVIRSQISVLLIAPLLRQLRISRRQRVCDGDLSSQAVEANNYV